MGIDLSGKAVRAGQVASLLVLGGRRVAVKSPAVRSVEGHDVALPSWLAWSAQDRLHERALARMVLGAPGLTVADATFASGNLVSTAIDIQSWNRSLLSATVLSPATLQRIFTLGP
jgi:hypothetical protein